MMQKVVLEGTGRKAILEGYTSAGKTGTAQKVDPATGAYSKTKYVGSFAGFAPVNNPQIVVAVILDSAVGLHQGGQISAPVFHRISQQVLEYLHMPHDLPLAPKHQLLLAREDERQRFGRGNTGPSGRAAGDGGSEGWTQRRRSPAWRGRSTPRLPRSDGNVVQAAMREAASVAR